MEAQQSDQPIAFEGTAGSRRAAFDIWKFSRSDLPEVALKKIKQLSRLRNDRAMAEILWQWAWIALAIALGIRTQSDNRIAIGIRALIYVSLVVFIATRQHALGLLIHEGAHFRLLRNKKWNDWLSDVFLALPMGISTRVYRARHFQHHRHANGSLDPDLKFMMADPDYRWPKTPSRFLGVFIRQTLGLNLKEGLRLGKYWSLMPIWTGKDSIAGFSLLPEDKALFLIFNLGAAIALTSLHAWTTALLYWIIPSFTVLGSIGRLRAIAEHCCVPDQTELSASRYVKARLWERLLITPLNANYHLQHHLFPSVPFYRLPKLHAILLEDPRYRAEAHSADGYLFGEKSLYRAITNGSA